MSRAQPARALPQAVAVFAALLGAQLLVALLVGLRWPDLASDFLDLYGPGGLWILAAHVALVGAACRIAAAGRIDPLEPVYFLGAISVLVFVARPLQVLWVSDLNTPYLPSEGAVFRQALALGLLGTACFLLGYFAASGRRLAERVRLPHPSWSARRLDLIVGAYLAVGLLGFLLAIQRSGGLGTFASTLRGRVLLTESRSMALAATLFLIQAAALVTGTSALFARRHRLLFLASLGLSVVFGVLLGGRAGVLLTILALGVVLHYRLSARRNLAVRHAVALGLVLAFCIGFVITLGALRPGWEHGPRRFELETLAPTGASSRFLAEFTQFDWFVILLDRMPDQIGRQYGTTFAQFFVYFVPRALWENKPLPFDYTLTALVRGDESGSPFTLVGELFLNFGVLGVALGMLLAGIACRALYAYLERAPENPGVVLFYSATYANLLHFYTRNFAPMMFTYVLFVGSALVAVRFCARPDATAAPGARHRPAAARAHAARAEGDGGPGPAPGADAATAPVP